MPITLTFHDSQYPAQVAAQLRQGLRQRHLPGKFLYDSPAQAQRWLAYHQAYSPSRTEADLLALYERGFAAALQHMHAPPLHYVSLGCGGGRKDVRFLRQAQTQCPQLHFTPTDVSAALVVETMLHLQETLPAVPSSPYVLDLEAHADLSDVLAPPGTADSRRLLSCFGMIPNFDYTTFLPYIRSLLRPEDCLLVSANLSPTPFTISRAHILPQYDNPFAHTWFTGLLDSLGFPTAQLRLTVDAVPLRDDGHVWQIQAFVTFDQPVTISVDAETFDFAPGETLHVFFSNRFTPEVMPEILADTGLDIVEALVLDSREEGIYLCRPLA